MDNKVLSVNSISEGMGPVVLKITFADGEIIREEVNASVLSEDNYYGITNRLVQLRNRRIKIEKIMKKKCISQQD
jgi:hypothetical protein